jgi:lipoyl(octanoyl) transferase
LSEGTDVQARWLGRVLYEDTAARQRMHREQMLEDPDVPEVLWMVEHEPVVTLGRRADEAARDVPVCVGGAPIVRAERGGLATWHGPGQVVGYPILRLKRWRLSVPQYVCALEEGMIAWLDPFGVRGSRRVGMPGVWTSAGKIGFVGIHIRRDVTIHGFALNVSNDLSPFREFSTCGLTDEPVVSLASLVGSAPDVAESARTLGDAVLWAVLAASVDTPSRSR